MINRLNSHAQAKEDLMSASQVNAAKILLNKVLPDLKSTEVDVTSGGEQITGIAVSFKDTDDSKAD